MVDTTKIVRRYEVPGIGRVELIHAPDSNFHGPYYVKVEDYGLIARDSKTEEEARFRAGVELQQHLESKKTDLEALLGSINETLVKMSLKSVKLTLLDDFQVTEEKPTLPTQ